jgi:hypothetical protein
LALANRSGGWQANDSINGNSAACVFGVSGRFVWKGKMVIVHFAVDLELDIAFLDAFLSKYLEGLNSNAIANFERHEAASDHVIYFIRQDELGKVGSIELQAATNGRGTTILINGPEMVRPSLSEEDKAAIQALPKREQQQGWTIHLSDERREAAEKLEERRSKHFGHIVGGLFQHLQQEELLSNEATRQSIPIAAVMLSHIPIQIDKPFEIIDAAIDKHLRDYYTFTPGFARGSPTSASAIYNLQKGSMGQIMIRKLGETATELSFSGPVKLPMITKTAEEIEMYLENPLPPRVTKDQERERLQESIAQDIERYKTKWHTHYQIIRTIVEGLHRDSLLIGNVGTSRLNRGNYHTEPMEGQSKSELRTVWLEETPGQFDNWLKHLAAETGYELTAVRNGLGQRYFIERDTPIAQIDVQPENNRLKVRTFRLRLEYRGPKLIDGFIEMYAAAMQVSYGQNPAGPLEHLTAWMGDGITQATPLPPVLPAAVDSFDSPSGKAVPMNWLDLIPADYRIVIEMWNEGSTAKEVGEAVGLGAGRVLNIITEQRNKLVEIYGNEAKRLIKYHRG